MNKERRGLLMIPETLTSGASPLPALVMPENFEDQLAAAMLAPIEYPSSASSLLPYLLLSSDSSLAEALDRDARWSDLIYGE